MAEPQLKAKVLIPLKLVCHCGKAGDGYGEVSGTLWGGAETHVTDPPDGWKKYLAGSFRTVWLCPACAAITDNALALAEKAKEAERV